MYLSSVVDPELLPRSGTTTLYLRACQESVFWILKTLIWISMRKEPFARATPHKCDNWGCYDVVVVSLLRVCIANLGHLLSAQLR